MKNDLKTRRELLLRIEDLEIRLEEAEGTLGAIRRGAVDGILVSTPIGDRVYTLKTAEQPYRVFFEAMNESAVTLARDGNILYCNKRFSRLLNMPLKKLLGSQFLDLVDKHERNAVAGMISAAARKSRESTLIPNKGEAIPVNISISPFEAEGLTCVCAVITDLRNISRR
jgi:PAS domain S-box-containing protein